MMEGEGAASDGGYGLHELPLRRRCEGDFLEISYVHIKM
jgi:hypothetical protein